MVDSSLKSKKFNFYYKDSVQVLKLYEGTKQEEIISTLYKILNVDNSKNLFFYDDEGDQLVISSSMPDEIKIFVKDEFISKINDENKKEEKINDKNVTLNIDKSITVEKSLINEKEWQWIQSNDIIFEDKNSFETNADNKTLVFGNISFSSGIYYWAIKISHLYCCHDFGIVENTNPNNFKPSYFNESLENVFQIGLPSILEGEFASSSYINKITGPSSTSLSSADLKDMYYGCYLDMDKKYFCIFNETKEKLYKSTKLNKIEKATPYYFCKKHVVTVCLNIKNPPDFVLKQIETLKI